VRLHEAIKAHLEADPAVLAISAGRFYYLLIPQKTATTTRIPCVVYNRSGVDRQVTHCGTTDLLRTSVTLDCYATTLATAHDLADAVRQALIDFSGVLGGSLPVRAASLESEDDLSDIEPGLYRVFQSWTFWHSEE
jgi:hypothetical protein